MTEVSCARELCTGLPVWMAVTLLFLNPTGAYAQSEANGSPMPNGVLTVKVDPRLASEHMVTLVPIMPGTVTEPAVPVSQHWVAAPSNATPSHFTLPVTLDHPAEPIVKIGPVASMAPPGRLRPDEPLVTVHPVLFQ